MEHRPKPTGAFHQTDCVRIHFRKLGNKKKKKKRTIPGAVVDDDGRTRSGIHCKEKGSENRGGGNDGSATEIR